MQITRIDIRNFRNIQHARLDLTGRLILFGNNGQGKSSAMDAVRMALLGWCGHTTRAGAGFESLIRDGAPKAIVALTVTHADGTYTVTLTLARSGKSKRQLEIEDVTTGECWEALDAWYTRLGVDKRFAAVAMMPAAYLASKDLGDLVAETLCGGIDPDDVMIKAGEHSAWLAAFARLHRVTLDSAENLAQLGAAAYKWRTEVNRERKQQQAARAQLGDPAQPLDTEGSPLGPDDLERCAYAAESLRVKIATLEAELQAVVDAPDSGRVAKETADLEAQIPAVQAELERLTEELRIQEETLRGGQANHAGARGDNAAAEKDIRAKRKMLEGIAELETCPTCGQACSAAVWAAARNPLENDIEKAVALLASCRELEAAHLASVTKSHEALSVTRKALDATNATIRNARTRLGDLRVICKAHRPADDIQTELDTARERLELGARIVTDLEELSKATEFDNYLAATLPEVEHLDWAVRALKEGELLKGTIGNELDKFAVRLNTELEPLGYALGVQTAGKDVTFLLACPGQQARPVELCSRGQRTLAAAAVALAFADRGVPVLVDNLNDLDYSNRAAILGGFRQRAVGTVIAAASWQYPDMPDLDQVAAALAPVAVAWVDGGAIRVTNVVTAVKAA